MESSKSRVFKNKSRNDSNEFQNDVPDNVFSSEEANTYFETEKIINEENKPVISQDEYDIFIDTERRLKNGEDDIRDYTVLFQIDGDEEGNTILSGIRNAPLNPNKYYLDDKKTPRIKINNDERRKESISLHLKPEEKRLSEILEYLPHGLIDKQATGIGATYLELHCKRNSIIVTPTRALALNKMEDNFLYVGSKENGKTTPYQEIEEYTNNSSIEYKKILVVANSVPRLFDIMNNNNIDVYNDYFFLVDEIDSLQSDNYYRPDISKVIDFYFRFHIQCRALLSATVQEFSHPKLKDEPVTIIKQTEVVKRNLDLLFTDNINHLLSKKITEIINNSDDKILIAYNSTKNILNTIELLNPELQSQCAILCGEGSKAEVSLYYGELLNSNLPNRINFITSAYFTGLDIDEQCHLITVSNTKRVYSALSINKITQIYGRCRNGVLSDIIIYNFQRKPLEDLNTYKDRLYNKAEKVISLTNAADKIKEDDQDLTDLFNRIKHLIVEKAEEMLFNAETFKLIRYNIDDKIEISYFNIDALYENMLAYYSLYNNKDGFGLYYKLKEIHNVTYTSLLSGIPEQKSKDVIDNLKTIIQQELKSIQSIIIDMSQRHFLNDDYLKNTIKKSKGIKRTYYQRIILHYKYIETQFLTDYLFDIAFKNKKAYRSFKNAASFFILDKRHPFKSQVLKAFRANRKYSSDEIEEILSPIIKYHFFKTLPITRLVNLFKSFFKVTYTQGIYYKKGLNPLKIPKPINMMPSTEMKLNDYFEI